MGLEIAKIQNATLQSIANQADLDKDGIIKGRDELNAFEGTAKKAIKAGLVSKEDLKTTINLFEINLPSKNPILRTFAIESDEDKSEKLSGNELENYIDKAKKARNHELATDLEVENTTEGFYQAKSFSQKLSRAIIISTAILGAMALGGTVGRFIAPADPFMSSHPIEKILTLVGGVAGGVAATKATKSDRQAIDLDQELQRRFKKTT